MGTHIDAPGHLYKGAKLLDEIPLEDLIVPMVVIDVQEQVQCVCTLVDACMVSVCMRVFVCVCALCVFTVCVYLACVCVCGWVVWCGVRVLDNR